MLLGFPGMWLLAGQAPRAQIQTRDCPKHPEQTGKYQAVQPLCPAGLPLLSRWLTFKLLFLSQVDPLLRWNQRATKDRVSPGQAAGPRVPKGGRGGWRKGQPGSCATLKLLALARCSLDRMPGALLRGGCRKGAQAAWTLPPFSKTTTSLQQGPVFHK